MPKMEGDDVNPIEDDSDELPSDLEVDDEDGDESEEEKGLNLNDDADEDDLSLAEGSDNDDLIPLDGEVPEGLIEWNGSDVDSVPTGEEWDGIDGSGSKKRKRGETLKGKRKKLRSLPTFASYEEYAKMIEEGPEDDI